MANKINIAQVPEVPTISQLLGVDFNNKWAKIPGAKFATAEFVQGEVDSVKAQVKSVQDDIVQIMNFIPAPPYLQYAIVDNEVMKAEQWFQNGQLFVCEGDSATISLKKGIMPADFCYTTCYILFNTPKFELTIGEALETGGWTASFNGLTGGTLIEVIAMQTGGLYSYNAGIISTNRVF